MARMKKVDLIAKIAKEQNLDPEKLERMPMAELEKMDKVVPDAAGSDILGGGDAPASDPVTPSDAGQGSVVAQDSVSDAPVNPSQDAGSDETAAGPGAGDSAESDTVSEDSGSDSAPASQEDSDSVKAPEGKYCIGNHPVTGEPVYVE